MVSGHPSKHSFTNCEDDYAELERARILGVRLEARGFAADSFWEAARDCQPFARDCQPVAMACQPRAVAPSTSAGAAR